MVKRIAWIVGIALIIGTAVAASLRSPVKFSKFYSSCQYTFPFKKQVKFSSFALHNPERWVVDFDNTQPQSRKGLTTIASCPVKTIRTSAYKGAWRVVFDLKHKTKVRTHASLLGNNIIVEFPRAKQTVAPVKKKTAAPLALTVSKKPKRLVPVVIVIDPGHGGKDPGTTGRSGVHEKNVVLHISRYLAADLNSRYGFKAYMTRNKDVFLKLRQRLAVARRYRPNLFVAIHADAFKNPRSRGVSVFALSQRGATSEAARWLAERENASELVGGVTLDDKSHMLRSVLLDLSQTATIGTSMLIGQDILGSIKGHARLHHKRVEQAAFVVLKSPDIPSLLIETGFLSNKYEEAQLKKPSYQKLIAAYIARGIEEYFYKHPPTGTQLTLKRRVPRTYYVKRGDSLTKIALRYNSSVAKLKNYNKLRSTNLRVGQTIKLPV